MSSPGLVPPHVNPPTVDSTTVDTPKVDTPKGVVPKVDTPKGGVPKVSVPKIDIPTADAPTERVSSVETVKLAKKPAVSGNRKTCIHCKRGKTDSKFCTQRCIIKWMEANPEKMPKEAVEDNALVVKVDVEDPLPFTSSTSTPKQPPSPPKVIPRALKNLQIDMAHPGTKLKRSPETSGSNSHLSTKESVNSTTRMSLTSSSSSTIRMASSSNSSLIDSLPTMATLTQKLAMTPKAADTPTAAAKPPADSAKPSTPGSKGAAAKRHATSQLSLPSSKRFKVAKKTPQNSPKCVSFNLKQKENGPTKEPNVPSPSSSSASVTPHALERITGLLHHSKKSYDASKVKIPPGK